MEKYLETHKFPRLNYEEMENLNRLITSNKIESVTTNLTTNKGPGPEWFTGDFYQTFREDLITILLKLFQKVKRTHPNSY